jgi:hypothetical protein
MSADDLNTFLAQFSRAMLDPTAPLPGLWPSGAFGVFLVFVTQIGAGIPIGVLLGRDSGLSPLEMAGLYLASDVVLALTCEPMLLGLAWLSRRVDWLAALGSRLGRISGATGLSDGRVKGPLGLIMFSFVFAPAPARAASEAAGHGPLAGWSLAIIGDMLYFGVIMASTLLVISLFGDNRLTIAPVMVGAWLLPMLVQRWRGNKSASSPSAAARASRPRAAAAADSVDSLAEPRRSRRSNPPHDGRPRRSRRSLRR